MQSTATSQGIHSRVGGVANGASSGYGGRAGKWGTGIAAAVGAAFVAGSYVSYVHAEEGNDVAREAVSPSAFQPLMLEQVQRLNHNTNVFTFALPEDCEEFSMPVASCVVVKAGTDEEGKPVIRPYTPINKKGSDKLELLVKVYPDGKGSSFIFNLKPGDELEFKGPFVKLAYAANMKKEIGMLAGGTGVTPMLQVLREILDNPEDKTKVTLVFGNQSERDILLRKELDQMVAEHPDQFKVHYMLDSAPEHWNGGKGFVTTDVIRAHLPAPSDDSMVFVCGPPPFVKAVAGAKNGMKQGDLSGALKDCGYAESAVFKF